MKTGTVSLEELKKTALTENLHFHTVDNVDVVVSQVAGVGHLKQVQQSEKYYYSVYLKGYMNDSPGWLNSELFCSAELAEMNRSALKSKIVELEKVYAK